MKSNWFKLLLATVATAVLSLAGCQATAPSTATATAVAPGETRAPKRYVDEKLGLAVNDSQEWFFFGRIPGKAVSFTAEQGPPQLRRIRPLVTIMGGADSGRRSVDEVAHFSLKATQQRGSDFQLSLDPAEVMLDGEPARRMAGTFRTRDGVPVRLEQLTVLRGGLAYFVSYRAEQDEFETHRPAALKIIKSISWLTPAGQSP